MLEEEDDEESIKALSKTVDTVRKKVGSILIYKFERDYGSYLLFPKKNIILNYLLLKVLPFYTKP